MAADPRPGRVCPLRYRYPPEALDRSPQFRACTAYVTGGLYGNREALDSILAMAEHERQRGADAALIFNGDFNWLNVCAEDFVQINEAVLRHAAIQGNVEAELATDGDAEAGCGCAYPDYVDDAVVARSNGILARLRGTAAAFPELRRRLADLPMTLTIEVGDERIAVVHGDAEALAGWTYAVEAMPPEGATPVRRIHDDLRRTGARVVACTHTGLPHARRFVVDGRAHLVINNGSAWMPNFAATRFGVITRISADGRIPEASLYGCALGGLRVDALPVYYDHEAWLRRFLRDWPEGSPAHLSYHGRFIDGPRHSLGQAARDGVRVYAAVEQG